MLGSCFPSHQLAFYGGEVVQKLDETTTHIVVGANSTVRLDALKRRSRFFAKKLHVVASTWVTESVAAKWRKEEDAYRL